MLAAFITIRGSTFFSSFTSLSDIDGVPPCARPECCEFREELDRGIKKPESWVVAAALVTWISPSGDWRGRVMPLGAGRSRSLGEVMALELSPKRVLSISSHAVSCGWFLCLSEPHPPGESFRVEEIYLGQVRSLRQSCGQPLTSWGCCWRGKGPSGEWCYRLWPCTAPLSPEWRVL